MWRRRIHADLRESVGALTEKQPGNQAAIHDAARLIAAASIEPTPGYLKRVAGNVSIAAENTTSTLEEVGNYYNVGLVIASTGFQPCLPFTHLVGCSHVCVPVGASDFQTAEFVNQEEVDHARDRIGQTPPRRHP